MYIRKQEGGFSQQALGLLFLDDVSAWYDFGRFAPSCLSSVAIVPYAR